ncbi:hypothetical protein [Streptomyces sp. NPDC047070]|uniref:hypothetical protein n=1 Tax=Streptomyces sp. NPDC047070 TaxID=3154923 RepID=UPI003456C5AC
MAIRDGTPEAHGADDPGPPEGLAPHLGGVAPGQAVAVALPRPEGDSQHAPIVARNRGMSFAVPDPVEPPRRNAADAGTPVPVRASAVPQRSGASPTRAGSPSHEGARVREELV